MSPDQISGLPRGSNKRRSGLLGIALASEAPEYGLPGRKVLGARFDRP